MRRAIVAAIILVVSVGAGHAGTRADLSGDAVVDFVTTMDMPLMNVGNPGNAGEWSGENYGGYGPDRICGTVDYEYNIGKFEVTAGQYTEFLNAVAATDTYGLYDTRMWLDAHGCRIERTGSDGSYAYSVAADWEDRPVNKISWGDAARLCNWLTNGMPTGAQDLATTEDGSYFLDGAMSTVEIQAVTRRADARYVIPSEDEWYKAAYHKNDGVTGDYFDYPTSSDARPSNDLVDPDPGNNANFEAIGGDTPPYDWPISLPYRRTEAGEFENSASPYGTFDQGGNVNEWQDAIMYMPWACHVYRGGSFFDYWGWPWMLAASYMPTVPTTETGLIGFRIAEVPEPGSAALLALGAGALLRRRRRISQRQR